jgi:peptidyl-prolyl cis-trans isomerase SurA
MWILGVVAGGDRLGSSRQNQSAFPPNAVRENFPMRRSAVTPSLNRLVSGLLLAAASGLLLAGAAMAQSPSSPPPPAGAAAKAAKPAKAKAERAPSSSAGDQAIVALVNDEPITAYEVEQRARLNSLSAGIGERAQENFKRMIAQESTTNQLKAILNEVVQQNQGKTREQILAIFEERKKQFALNLQKQAVDSARAAAVSTQRKGALEELVEERLKLQEAKRQNTLAEEADVDRVIKGIADRNKVSPEKFAENLRTMGADISAMRARFKATLSWNEVIRRRFGHQVSVAQRDVDRFVAKAGSAEDQLELQLQKITLLVASKIEQKQIAQRLQEAEALKARFTDCKSMSGLLKGTPASKHEDLGTRRLQGIAEPTRSMLANAKDGEMLPPTIAQSGVELWAVCGRKVVKAAEEKVAQAQDELRQKEFELISRRHLMNLRQDALIEYR